MNETPETLPVVEATEATLVPTEVKHFALDADGNRIEVTEEVLAFAQNEGNVATTVD